MKCDAFFPIFRPHKFIWEWGRKIIICVALTVLPNLQDLHPLQLEPNLVTLAQLVVRLPDRHEVVGSVTIADRKKVRWKKNPTSSDYISSNLFCTSKIQNDQQ